MIFFRGVWNGWVLTQDQILLFVIKMKIETVGRAVKLVKKRKVRFTFPVTSVVKLVTYVTQIHQQVHKAPQVLKVIMAPQVLPAGKVLKAL
jgi:hypothetical protein